MLSDLPPPEGLLSKAFGHVLGESEIVIYGSRMLARKYREGFPQSLAGAPMLLPAQGTSLRRLLERWFTEKEVHVQVTGEFDDAAMMRAFGVNGLGLFPVRAALAAEVEDGHGALPVGADVYKRQALYRGMAVRLGAPSCTKTKRPRSSAFRSSSASTASSRSSMPLRCV